MSEPYTPASDFLHMVIGDEIPLVGSDFADRNLRLLIAFMSDEDVSNRDWATMLLAGKDIDTVEVRKALIAAANDDEAAVRGEALEGLAERDKAIALPLVIRELQRDECGYGVFQAARIIGDPCLLDPLRAWAGEEGAPWIDDAIAACEAAKAGD